MAANGIKMEGGLIKNEPGLDDLDMADVDDAGAYEDDAGELRLPEVVPQGWLLRVPKELWGMLSHLNDDDEITLGEVRIWNNNDPKSKEQETIRLALNPQIPNKDLTLIPKQYDLTSQVTAPKNTFIFSEKNLPGFRNQRGGNNRTGGSQDLLRGVDGREGSVKVEKPRGPRTIPKHTEYLCTASRELVCTPRDNAEYRHIESLKRSATSSTANRTAFIHDVIAARELSKGSMLTSAGEESFIYTGISRKRGGQDNKATRMPKYDLIDALNGLFEEFKFWPMSALKKRLRQPEAWLKEVLGEIAVLVRTGQAANHYMLSKFREDEVKEEEIAPEVKGEDLGSEDDEEFEDIPA
jgi:transcription initiation factor TFIIF subunit beta